MKLFAVVVVTGFSAFCGMPYFIDPARAADFKEVHWAVGLLQSAGYLVGGWGLHEIWCDRARKRKAKEGG